MTAPTPDDVDGGKSDEQNDRAAPTGVATITTDPLALDIETAAIPHSGTIALKIRGADEHPGDGVCLKAYLSGEDAERLAMDLYQSADQIAGDEPTHADETPTPQATETPMQNSE